MEEMRLQKYLALCSVASRRASEEIILSGRVSVNGKVVTELGTKVSEGDIVKVDGKEIKKEKQKIYIMLNKPVGCVTTVNDDRGRQTIMEYVSDIPERIYPVGRLDYNTEGLIFLTNDGDLCHRVLSPKSHVDKTYFVKCEKALTDADVISFKDGVTLDDGYKTMSAHLNIDSSNPGECLLTIQEGKFHQVKRMMEAVGNKVIYLKRVKMGALSLDESLPLGKIRELTEEETAFLCQKTN